jgi:DNA replication protein DnaC
MSTDASRAEAPLGAPAPASEAACPLCGGARFVRVTADPQDPRFGQPVPCQCAQTEDASERRQRLLRYSRLGPLRRMTFEVLDPLGRSEDQTDQQHYTEAVSIAERFAAHPEGWLIITGAHGRGKTHLAAAIANRSIDRGEPALFLTVADLLDALRAGYDEEAENNYERVLEQVRRAPLLILDDLGGYSETAWAREKFLQVISHRFNALLPTVFTSVEPPEESEARLASRLTDPGVTQQIELGEGSGPRFFAVGAMGRDQLARFTLDQFDPSGRGLRGESRRNLEGAFRLARQWAAEPDGWLVFLGANGCGKTHLAAGIAAERLAQGDAVAFANVPDLLDELRATFAPGSRERFDHRFRRLLDAPVLVLDDLGAQQTSAWAEEKLYQILNHRHLQRKPTIVTTNCELKVMEPRIASRLADLQTSTVYQITAPDYRTGAADSPDPPPPPKKREPYGRKTH